MRILPSEDERSAFYDNVDGCEVEVNDCINCFIICKKRFLSSYLYSARENFSAQMIHNVVNTKKIFLKLRDLFLDIF